MCNEGKSEGDRDLQVEAALSGVFNSLHVHNYVAEEEEEREAKRQLHMICGLLSDSFSQRRHPRVG